jgi:hypothetical protein
METSQVPSANLAKCAFADGAVEIKMKKADLAIEINWFREAAAHVAFPG